MKKYLLLPVIILFAISCEGPVGPQGPEGPQGAIGQMFEKVVSFTPDHSYEELIIIPENVIIDDTDIIVGYWLYAVNEQTQYDVWQQLPASIFFEDGAELQYAYDYTVADIRLYLTGDINLTTLGGGWTKDQVFRFIILPADWVNANKVNLKDMEAVMKLVDKTNIKRYGVNELQVNKN